MREHIMHIHSQYGTLDLVALQTTKAAHEGNSHEVYIVQRMSCYASYLLAAGVADWSVVTLL